MEKMENTKSVTNECARDSKQQEDLELFVTGAT